MKQKVQRILSLDGGGLRGVFSAAVVHHMENATGRPARELFDALIGTSTGSVMAAMLATGKPAASLMQLYQDVGTAIFDGQNAAERSTALEKTLLTHIGPAVTFGQIKGVSLAIPFRDTRSGKVVFASNFLQGRKKWKEMPLWKIVRRSTALIPLFTPVDDRYLDGGYSAYANPSYAALRAAVEKGWMKAGKPKALQIHSVGTSYQAPLAGKLGLDKGIGKWLGTLHRNLNPSELLQIFVNEAMIQDVSFLQHQLLKAAAQRDDLTYRRYNIKLQPGKFDRFKKAIEEANIATDRESLIRTYRIMDGGNSMQHLAMIGEIVAASEFKPGDFPQEKPVRA